MSNRIQTSNNLNVITLLRYYLKPSYKGSNFKNTTMKESIASIAHREFEKKAKNNSPQEAKLQSEAMDF